MNVPLPSTLSSEVLDSLRELQSDEDPFFLANLMTLFLTSLMTRIEAMGKAVEAGDTRVLGSEAHALKSSSGNVGAVVLSGFCEELETLGKSGQLTGAALIYNRLHAEAKSVRAAIALLPEMKAFKANQAA